MTKARYFTHLDSYQIQFRFFFNSDVNGSRITKCPFNAIFDVISSQRSYICCTLSALSLANNRDSCQFAAAWYTVEELMFQKISTLKKSNFLMI